MLNIFIDADGCPVKEEIYRVARRHGLGATLVANALMRIPEEDRFTLVVVGDRFDAADDWIGDALANRELLSHLRNLGTITGGPPPFSARDRSRFLHRLDETIRAVRRRNPG